MKKLRKSKAIKKNVSFTRRNKAHDKKFDLKAFLT